MNHKLKGKIPQKVLIEEPQKRSNSFSESNSSNTSHESLTGLEKVRNEYLNNKHNHTLKCALLTVAEKRSHKIFHQTNKALYFQQKFFERRGIKPSIDDVIGLSNTIRKFAFRLNKSLDSIQRKKISCFLKWKMSTFGYQNELMRAVNQSIQNKRKIIVKKQDRIYKLVKLSITRRQFEYFNHWKCMVKLNFPIFPSNKRYKEIIPRLIKEYNLKLYQSTKEYKFGAPGGYYKIEEKRLDEISFFQRLNYALDTIERRIHQQYGHFFFQCQLNDFVLIKNTNNYQILQSAK